MLRSSWILGWRGFIFLHLLEPNLVWSKTQEVSPISDWQPWLLLFLFASPAKTKAEYVLQRCRYTHNTDISHTDNREMSCHPYTHKQHYHKFEHSPILLFLSNWSRLKFADENIDVHNSYDLPCSLSPFALPLSPGSCRNLVERFTKKTG